MSSTSPVPRPRFRTQNLLAALTLAAFWLAIFANPPERANSLSQLGLIALPLATVGALADRFWLGLLAGCLAAFWMIGG
jgi:hypothetical protein